MCPLGQRTKILSPKLSTYEQTENVYSTVWVTCQETWVRCRYVILAYMLQDKWQKLKNIFLCVCMYMCMCIYVCIYMYMCVCICMCTHILYHYMSLVIKTQAFILVQWTLYPMSFLPAPHDNFLLKHWSRKSKVEALPSALKAIEISRSC